MSALELLGALLLAAPFIAIGAIIKADIGWTGLLWVLGFMFAILAPITLGVYLLTGRG
jgi:hypothetical protein